MRKPLTSKQKLTLSVIRDLINKKGVPPKLEELRVALNLSSISSVQRHTDALKKKGYLNNTRGLSVPDSPKKIQIPLVGNIACGTPLLASENIEAYIFYDVSKLRGTSQDYFFLRAVGDSMNDTNISGKAIDDGDYVLVRKQPTVDYGKRVVALIGNEATIKRFIKRDGEISLEPETSNSNNKPILILDDEISIQGEVVDVIKKGGG